MSFSIDFTGKTVVITGVSSGIGAGIAKMFAMANANIAGCALEDEGHQLVEEFTDSVFKLSGKKPLYIQADVTQYDQLEYFINQTILEFGAIDFLASNAGTNIYRGAVECTIPDWNLNLDINLSSHWYAAKLCKPYLEKNEGVIIFNTSCHAFSTLPGSFPYNIAKTGLKSLVQSLTVEWGPLIRVVGIAPGFTDTPLATEWFNEFEHPELKRSQIENGHPLKRLATTEELGGWFVFLCSKYAAFAGGQTYLIDGGRSALMMNTG